MTKARLQQIVETAYSRANGDWTEPGDIPLEQLHSTGPEGDPLLTFLLTELVWDGAEAEPLTLGESLGRARTVLKEVEAVHDAIFELHYHGTLPPDE